MPRRQRVEISEIVRAELSDDGAQLLLTMAGAGGETVVLSLPACSVGEILAALPRQLSETAADTVHRVHSWRLEAAADAAELTLTLQTPEGRAAAFQVTPGQVAGMATLATYGMLSAATAKTIN